MKITTNFLNTNFTGPLYIKGETVDKADIMCRSIATELEFDKIIKSNLDETGDSFVSKEGVEAEKGIAPEELFGITPYPYNDSALLLKLRETSGLETDFKPQAQSTDDIDIKSKFTLPEVERKLDIKA